MDWDNKFSSIVEETETNLERAHQQLGQIKYISRPRSAILNSDKNGISYEMSQSLTERYPQDTDFYPTNVSRLSASTTDLGDDSTVRRDGRLKYVPADRSRSIVALLSEKINCQDKTIEMLTQRLEKKEEEQVFYSKQLRDLQNVVSKLQQSERVGGPQVDFEKFKDDFVQNVRHVHRQVDALKSSFEMASAQNDTKMHNLTTTVYDLRSSSTGELDLVRRELETLKLRLGTVEFECGRAVRQHSSSRPDNENEFQRSVQPSFSVQDRSFGSRNVSFMNPGRSSAHGVPDLAELQNDYQTLQRKLQALESNFKRDEMESGGRKSRKSAARKSAQSILSSPNTSDLDLTSASEQFTSYSSRVNSRRNRSTNNNNTLTDDLTTDDCLSLDDLA